jgi:hypothetical protein
LICARNLTQADAQFRLAECEGLHGRLLPAIKKPDKYPAFFYAASAYAKNLI